MTFDLTEPGESLRVQRVAAPLRQQVVDELRRAIVEQRLVPGQRLVERELIEQIGVSRTTIREALRELAAEGYVETIPQKGAIVALASAGQTRDIYEAWAALAPLQVVAFAQHAPQRADELAVVAAQAGEAAAAGNADGVLSAERRFAALIDAGAANATVTGIIEGLRSRVSGSRAVAFAAEPALLAESATALAGVAAALAAGQGDAAAAAYVTALEAAAAAAVRTAAPDHP
jgi:DNA-binding GntR family transcriptional regulator